LDALFKNLGNRRSIETFVFFFIAYTFTLPTTDLPAQDILVYYFAVLQFLCAYCNETYTAQNTVARGDLVQRDSGGKKKKWVAFPLLKDMIVSIGSQAWAMKKYNRVNMTAFGS